MEALLIGIPFFLYIYLRVTLGNDITHQERDEALFAEGILLYNSGDVVKAFRYFNSVMKEQTYLIQKWNEFVAA